LITPDSPVAVVLGATKKGDKVEKLGLRTVGDLLAHFPRIYLKTGELTAVDGLEPGQQLTVVGRIAKSAIATYPDRRSGRTAYRVDVLLATNGPSLRMSFFAKSHHTAEWQQRRMPVGVEGVFTGRISSFRSEWQLTNPEMVMFNQPEEKTDSARIAAERLKGLFPVYRATKGVESWDLQKAIAFALTILEDVPDVLPESLREQWSLIDSRTALDWIHSPEDYTQVGAAQRRFRFEEALVTQLVMVRRREATRLLGTKARAGGGGLLAEFDRRLPFDLTNGQREIGHQLEEDLAQPHPMNRLLQGEVGSGKTLVALRAMLRVIDSGGQAAPLAPTKVLAQQHRRSISAMLGDLASGGMLGGAEGGTTIALLTGSMGRAARQEHMLRIASGEAGIVIGTHALLEDRVTFADLGLVVVDEQHRFGVEQRAAPHRRMSW
jgi:ATP-dependent DNA helicase RecG